MFYRRLSYVIFVLALFSLSIRAQAFEGKVVSITDGDTITVMDNGVPEKIRLNGIDCPEKGQPFGNRAKQFTGDMVFGKIVTIKEHGKDKYGRTIGDVLLPGGKNINKELVKAGLAWWYHQYSNNKELAQLEQEAKSSKRGLWSDSNPVPPWNWRHNKSSSAKSTQNKSLIEHAASIASTTANKTVSEKNTSPVITGTPTGETTPRGYPIYEGPRGGRYHISPKSGKKVYEKRSK
jgi:micrococcal nuclease